MELETCQGLRSNRLRLGLYRLEATQRSVVRVQEVFPCTPATWRTRVWAAPTVLARPLGSRSRGQCAVGTHFKGFGVKGARALLTRHNGISQRLRCVALLGCLVIGGRMSPVSLKLPHAPPYHLITFKCSCRASLWPLAEPFQPKLGLSLYERLMPIFTPSRIIPN